MVVKSARAKLKGEARDRAREMTYNVSHTNNKLELPSSFSIGDDIKWRGQHIKLVLRVPSGQPLSLAENIDEVFDHNKATRHLADTELYESNLEMLEDGRLVVVH